VVLADTDFFMHQILDQSFNLFVGVNDAKVKSHSIDAFTTRSNKSLVHQKAINLVLP
jgi:hypothetical protein